jgi:hypothetical protein
VRILKHEPYGPSTKGREFAFRQSVELLAKHDDMSAAGAIETGNQVEEGRLA